MLRVVLVVIPMFRNLDMTTARPSLRPHTGPNVLSIPRSLPAPNFLPRVVIRAERPPPGFPNAAKPQTRSQGCDVFVNDIYASHADVVDKEAIWAFSPFVRFPFSPF